MSQRNLERKKNVFPHLWMVNCVDPSLGDFFCKGETEFPALEHNDTGHGGRAAIEDGHVAAAPHGHFAEHLVPNGPTVAEQVLHLADGAVRAPTFCIDGHFATRRRRRRRRRVVGHLERIIIFFRGRRRRPDPAAARAGG